MLSYAFTNLSQGDVEEPLIIFIIYLPLFLLRALDIG